MGDANKGARILFRLLLLRSRHIFVGGKEKWQDD